MPGPGPTDFDLIVLYPSQVAMFEAEGWVRGRDFIVYKCLRCMEDMDRCKCKKRKKRKKRGATDAHDVRTPHTQRTCLRPMR